MLAYCSIVLTAVAAYAGAPFWAALPAAAVLVIIAMQDHRRFAARFANLGVTPVLTAAAWQSAAYALMASGAAWAVGAVSRLLLTV